ncbi:MAG: MarR family transcriptional regulator [Myxococcales bacterium]|nr:MarR family transcriptional regulator [Myxococcales bacterium]
MSGPDLELRRLQTQAMLDLGRIRHVTDRVVEGLFRDAGLVDVTPAQGNALLALINARKPLTAAQLARQLALSEVTVGRFVRSLVDSGWVARTPDPNDSRALLLQPTAKARQALPQFIAVSNGLLDRAFRDWDRDDILTAVQLLRSIRENLDPDEDAEEPLRAD